LARLLKLNHQRAAEELNATGPATTKTKVQPKQPAIQFPATDLPLFQLPTTRTFLNPREPYDSGLVYAVQLVRALLAEAGGTMSWPRLVDSFTLATQPTLLIARAAGEDAKLAKKWRKLWRETPPPGALITAIEQLGPATLDASHTAGIWLISLQDGPKPPLNQGVMDDAWLALRVLGPAPEIPAPLPTVSISEFEDWTHRLETVFTH
jgi:hypothetical protein